MSQNFYWGWTSHCLYSGWHGAWGSLSAGYTGGCDTKSTKISSIFKSPHYYKAATATRAVKEKLLYNNCTTIKTVAHWLCRLGSPSGPLQVLLWAHWEDVPVNFLPPKFYQERANGKLNKQPTLLRTSQNETFTPLCSEQCQSVLFLFNNPPHRLGLMNRNGVSIVGPDW